MKNTLLLTHNLSHKFTGNNRDGGDRWITLNLLYITYPRLEMMSLAYQPLPANLDYASLGATWVLRPHCCFAIRTGSNALESCRSKWMLIEQFYNQPFGPFTHFADCRCTSPILQVGGFFCSGSCLVNPAKNNVLTAVCQPALHDPELNIIGNYRSYLKKYSHHSLSWNERVKTDQCLDANLPNRTRPIELWSAMGKHNSLDPSDLHKSVGIHKE